LSHHAFGQASVSEINHNGIVKATFMAMRRALKALKNVNFLLSDSFYIPFVPSLPKKMQLAIRKGDKHCFSIAAASILAKVYRDRLLVNLGKQYPKYFLQNHKGYGTLAHREAILSHGPQSFHRQLFIRKYV
jgi:ribonuclease HII